MERPDDLQHGYLRICPPEVHQHALTRALLEDTSEQYRHPVLFRGMARLAPELGTRAFLETDPRARYLWREREGTDPVAFRGPNHRTDYNYVSGRTGRVRDLFDAVFEEKREVYAYMGDISSGFSALRRYPWGEDFFHHVRDAALAAGWFQIPDWELRGHAFLGFNATAFAEPSEGAPGSDWHMFPTANLFVALRGTKRWSTHPPAPGDQLTHHEELIYPSGGRESPVEPRPHDVVHVEAGDVLFNPPYEWHKVVNHQGITLGLALRIVDRPYLDQLVHSPTVAAHLGTPELTPDMAHLITSLRMASFDPRRMAMVLNTAELMALQSARLGAGAWR
ncbi:MAG: hypothetical protein EP330_00180 [Deltaproteobacteria bacterium]|nr:MAG: hypothetical protein EP330_00180 [Deltaproteobacteria bacterium]